MSALPHADPGRGVFETMLVLAGRAVELDAHLGRLATSVEALYRSALPTGAGALVADRAGWIECGKLRLTVAPVRGALRLDVSAGEIDPGSVFPGANRGASLRSHVVAGGLGEHKWADRDLLDRLTAAAPGELPLLLDADGTVLEASRASLFIVKRGRLLTPPTDGRILPSIARQQTIEVAAAAGIATSEERLTVDDLLSAEVFLTGSVRGVEPARSLDGADLAPPGEISGRVAAGLRDRWRAPAGEPAAAVAAGPPSDPPGH
ncbi:MAG TPA: aminotransferase class IV [Solirubrobacterales bacterium]|jgi:para-aminobenzoate synthetase/4-amino-4-deoxychorismate lyase|nr:aminotransferase class IV [Solirubrobacterales bacterium]